MLVSLYNGNVHIWNYESQVSFKPLNVDLHVHVFYFKTLIKSFEVTDLPVRAARFVARKSWVVTGSVSI